MIWFLSSNIVILQANNKLTHEKTLIIHILHYFGIDVVVPRAQILACR